MARFDFIADDDLRASLDSDFAELEIAFNGNAFKAVHVLAGSIIEAVLVDSLIALGIQQQGQKDVTKLTLGELIALSKKQGIINDAMEHLSTVVQSYRNLIHPGRMLRLQETVDHDRAQVAVALVNMIVKETERKRRGQLVYSARQIIDKIERDYSVLPTLRNMLQKMSHSELDKLLRLLPKEQIERAVEADLTGDHFFQASDLKHLHGEDRDMVVQHVLHRAGILLLRNDLRPLHGIGAYVGPAASWSFFDTFVWAAGRTKNPTKLLRFFASEYHNMPKVTQKRMERRIQELSEVDSDPDNAMQRNMQYLQSLISEDELPF